jgi:hypothetical protein
MILGCILFFTGAIWLGTVNNKIIDARTSEKERGTKLGIWEKVGNDCLNRFVNALRGIDGSIKNWALMVKTSRDPFVSNLSDERNSLTAASECLRRRSSRCPRLVNM